MQTIRPFQVAVIAIAVVLALGGLYVFTTFKGFNNSGAQIGKVTIWGTLPADAVNAGIDLLSADNTQYAEVNYVERSAATFSSDLANAIASGEGPDAIIISQEELLSERNKLSILPYDALPQRTFISSYLPIYELFLTAEGSYGVPLVLDPLVLYYNRAILASRGVVTTPVNWEAISGLALALTIRDDRGTIAQSFIPFGEYQNVTNARAILSLLLLQSGATITEETQTGVRSTLIAREGSGADSFADSAVSFYAQFADPAKTVYSWNRSLPESRQAFISGDVVAYPGYASEQSYLAVANPNLDFDMSRMPQPATSSTLKSYARAYVIAFPRSSANINGAMSAALGIASPDSMKAIAMEAKMAPARRDLLNAPSNDRFASVYYQDAVIATGWLSPAPYITDAIFSAMINDVITGRLDVSQAVQKADQALNAALR
jgi:ABC-type glycerol-3-phosphate transport system substrate-binding protein